MHAMTVRKPFCIDAILHNTHVPCESCVSMWAFVCECFSPTKSESWRLRVCSALRDCRKLKVIFKKKHLYQAQRNNLYYALCTNNGVIDFIWAHVRSFCAHNNRAHSALSQQWISRFILHAFLQNPPQNTTTHISSSGSRKPCRKQHRTFVCAVCKCPLVVSAVVHRATECNKYRRFAHCRAGLRTLTCTTLRSALPPMRRGHM